MNVHRGTKRQAVKQFFFSLLLIALAPILLLWERYFVLYAKHKGNEGLVHIGTNAIAELREFELTEEGTQIDSSVLVDTWDKHETGSNRWSGSASAFWDETDTNGQEQINVGTKVGLTMYGEGTAGGATKWVGTASPSQITRRWQRNNMVGVDFNFVGDGALVQGTA